MYILQKQHIKLYSPYYLFLKVFMCAYAVLPVSHPPLKISFTDEIRAAGHI